MVKSKYSLSQDKTSCCVYVVWRCGQIHMQVWESYIKGMTNMTACRNILSSCRLWLLLGQTKCVVTQWLGYSISISGPSCPWAPKVCLMQLWLVSSNYLTVNVGTVNVGKPMSMFISRSRFNMLSLTITVNGTPLENVKCFQVLRPQAWLYWLSVSQSNASDIFSPHCDTVTILSLYKAHILPILDYSCIV